MIWIAGSRGVTMVLIAGALSCSRASAGANAELASSPEKVVWSTENLGSAINSPYHDAFPTISRDGLVLYFASDRATYAEGEAQLRPWTNTDFDIYVATRKRLTEPWGLPRRLPSHINTPGEDHSVSLSPDGHWLYFSSDQLGGCGELDIFKSYRADLTDDLGWGEPVNLGCEVNSPKHDVCVIYHEDEDGSTSLYFVSNRPGGMGSLDIYESRLDPEADRFTEPILMESVSSPSFDGHLDPEAGFIWTMRDGGLGGSDLWVSKRGQSGAWEAPVNLGPAINTEFEEQMPSPFDDGRVLYFPSDRPGGYGGLDIYVSERAAKNE